jgi:hypothetical protein
MSDTTIHVQDSDVSALDSYKIERFGHTDVSYRATIRALLADAGVGE